MSPVPARVPARKSCRTSVEGDECFARVVWSMQTGVVKYPEWFAPLTGRSSFEAFQRHLHGSARFSSVCPEPCGEPSERVVAAPAHASVFPGYELVGSNCLCGNKIKGFSDEHETLELCASECNLYPHCMAIGLHPPEDAMWGGHCDLYDALCPATDGHDANTTCANPLTVAALSNNYNKVPTPSPTPVPPPPAVVCDVINGSSPSSQYPCQCDSSVCELNQLCSAGSCMPMSVLHVQWPCSNPGIGNPYFSLAGTSQTGAPIYSNADGNSIYWDASCDGYVRAGDDRVPRWILDQGVPSLDADMDLDLDGQCSYFGHTGSDDKYGVPLGDSNWTVFCDGAQLTATVAITMLHDMPATATPSPTLEPGVPCACEGRCGTFPYMDVDGDGCLSQAETDLVEQLAGHFTEMDADEDGCVTQDECAASDFSADLPTFPIQGPAHCDYGWCFMPGTSVCVVCPNGETRRRRSESCTDCPAGKTDVGDFDNCIGGIYLLQPIGVGGTVAFVNTDTDESGYVLTKGDSINIATRNPGHYEVATIQDKIGFDSSRRPSPAHEALLRSSGPFFVLEEGARMPFETYDAVTLACSAGDGRTFSSNYPCGCGVAVCQSGERCDLSETSGFGSAGLCIPGPAGAPLPTPAPTISARGDPHLVNLNGEHFDVNHGGEFTLLQIPQTTRPPLLELKASIGPEFGKPCTTYITELELSGLWLDGQVVQVRSYLRSREGNETDKFLGLRVLRPTSVPSQVPWEKLDERDDPMVISEGRGHSMRVTLSTTKWHTNKRAWGKAPNVAGQVEIGLQNIFHRHHKDAATQIVMRQDLPLQEHLNLAVRHLSSLARMDIGGLLGFDPHPESLEDVTPECQRHRDGLDRERGPRSKKAWKVRWEKVKDRQRGQAQAPGGSMNDNEAASSLIGQARQARDRYDVRVRR
ncbi:unnamed protein product [Prorocentrum cordatum]|uniref:EF-hand domain-containing protein n=1 Tax=Prorocentrum cordatum TaxID=2364126 RepID=A0ABN9TKW7_9DINO|nr:unnamed protein product [Polarella glacialis]